jgi:fatty acid elongase 2
MLMGLAWDTPKTESIHAVICEPIDVANPMIRSYIQFAYHAFLYSKYWEWLDTLFLHLGGRAISTLQYTHHMSTAFLVATNMSDIYTPSIVIYGGLNCFVHIPMYWYFAYPKGALRPFAAWITRIQIIQHIICIGVSGYINYRIYAHIDCYHGSRYGIQFALALYGMYLFYFTMFYVGKYLGGGEGGKKKTS